MSNASEPGEQLTAKRACELARSYGYETETGKFLLAFAEQRATITERDETIRIQTAAQQRLAGEIAERDRTIEKLRATPLTERRVHKRFVRDQPDCRVYMTGTRIELTDDDALVTCMVCIRKRAWR